MLKRLQQAYKRDRLGVLGVSSAGVAVLLIGLPAEIYHSGGQIGEIESIHGGTIPLYAQGHTYLEWFSTERLPAASVFGFISVILLLLRRR